MSNSDKMERPSNRTSGGTGTGRTSVGGAGKFSRDDQIDPSAVPSSSVTLFQAQPYGFRTRTNRANRSAAREGLRGRTIIPAVTILVGQ